MTDVEKDAKGQYAKSVGDRKASGVASAKPTVVTGSEDATEHKTPPGKKPVKDWDINYDPADMKARPGSPEVSHHFLSSTALRRSG